MSSSEAVLLLGSVTAAALFSECWGGYVRQAEHSSCYGPQAVNHCVNGFAVVLLASAL
jgi:hypothetical protein